VLNTWRDGHLFLFLHSIARAASGDTLAGSDLSTAQIKALAAVLPGTLVGDGSASVAPLGATTGEPAGE
jgi:hypothetical protein